MSNTSVAGDLAQPLRRSTRIPKTVPITVMGVDSSRGPYREDVSTVAVSCHGCRFESKHDMPINSWVMLELPARENSGETVSARGLVKWVKPPQDDRGVYETAIELNDTGNIWGVETPPQDWMKFCESHSDQANSSRTAKSFAIPNLEQHSKIASTEKSSIGESAHTLTTTSSRPFSTERPAGLLGGQFHEQMERMLFDAADAAVRERANSTLDEVRRELREEAKRVLSEVAASQSGAWMDQSLKLLNNASQETVKNFHAAWAKWLESDVRRAVEHVEERGREFDVLAQTLSANALDRLQRGLEASRTEGLDHIVARLEEKSASLIARANEAMAELSKQKDEFQATVEQTLAHSTAKIEEACTGLAKQREEFQATVDHSLLKSTATIEDACTIFQKQFESIVRDRLDAARDEINGVIRSATAEGLDRFTGLANEQQVETQSRLREAIPAIAETALNEIKEKAAHSSLEFVRELNDRSRAQLELVSNSIADAARALAELPSE
jgi:hypothetical protein